MNIITRETYNQILVQQSFERIEVAAMQAMKQGLEAPTVLVLDPLDDVARAIIAESDRESEIEIQIAEYRQRGVRASIIWFLPGRLAAALLRPSHPQAADEILPLPDPRAYFIVAVAQRMVSVGEGRLE